MISILTHSQMKRTALHSCSVGHSKLAFHRENNGKHQESLKKFMMLPCHNGWCSGQPNQVFNLALGDEFLHCLLAHQVKNTSIFPWDTLHSAVGFYGHWEPAIPKGTVSWHLIHDHLSNIGSKIKNEIHIKRSISKTLKFWKSQIWRCHRMGPQNHQSGWSFFMGKQIGIRGPPLEKTFITACCPTSCRLVLLSYETYSKILHRLQKPLVCHRSYSLYFDCMGDMVEHDAHVNSSQKNYTSVCSSLQIYHDLPIILPSHISAIFSIDHWLIMLNPHLVGKTVCGCLSQRKV